MERSPYADRLVLRGSLVTRRFFPSRKCEDVDHLLQGGKADELKSVADAVIAVPDEEPLEIVAREKLWPDTDMPGHRVVFANGVQVDIGFGDPITVAPERVTIEGASVLAVRPESMIAWKLHGIVELGPRGRWRPKDLHDLFLYAALDVDEAEVRNALSIAFSSRGHSVSLLESLMTDATWGTSRGSRNRWKRFRRDEVASAPALPDAIAKVRARFAGVVRSVA
ncbi:MAG TPA: nucleotidyl transferase AbiEii/AbiGii toxin family protein [Polyangiaceae bacterium]